MQPESGGNACKAVYLVAVCLRFLFAFSAGYIHPDEFFQSQEIAAADVFRTTEYHRAWEFTGAARCRSIAPLLVITGIPYYAYSVWHRVITGTYIQTVIGPFASAPSLPSAVFLLVAPRIWLFCLSFTIDRSILRITKMSRSESSQVGGGHMSLWGPLLFYSTSWVTILLLTRPFSNTLETLVMALAFDLTMTSASSPGSDLSLQHILQLVLLGAIFAFGIFTRFTFVFVALPMSAFIICHQIQLTTMRHLLRVLSVIAALLFGAVLVSMICIRIDTAYYDALTSRRSSNKTMADTVELADAFNSSFGSLLDKAYKTWGISITPLNNLAYNLQTANLQKHGVHPRYTHALVNLPMLFGLAGWRTVLQWLRSVLTTPRWASSLRSRPCPRTLANAVVVTYFAALSVAPHQEPRFLAPLIVPLALLNGEWICNGGGIRGRMLSHGGNAQINHRTPRDCDDSTMNPNRSMRSRRKQTRQHNLSQRSRSCGRGRNSGRKKDILRTTTKRAVYLGADLPRRSHNRRNQRLREFPWAWSLHLTLTGMFLLFFGVLHQAGVVPALLYLTADRKNDFTHNISLTGRDDLVCFKTYMPPRFLLMRRHDQLPQPRPQLQVFDLNGAGYDALCAKLKSLAISHEHVADTNMQRTWVLAPDTVFVTNCTSGKYIVDIPRCTCCSLIPVVYFSPHLSMEDTPWGASSDEPWWSLVRIGVYEADCSSCVAKHSLSG